jgi:ribulose-phosphate 3-epimerase
MIEHPEKYVTDFINAGTDILTFHYEAVEGNEIIGLCEEIRKNNVKVGMAIKPKTSPDKILKFLPYLDMLLVMTVEPGFGGQKFMQDCADKIPQIKENAQKNLIIQVDGGINNTTAKICTELGALSLVAGNYIYKSDNIEKAIHSLK